MMDNVRTLRPEQEPEPAPELVMPSDPYLAAVEANVIRIVARSQTTGHADGNSALVWSQARAVYLAIGPSDPNGWGRDMITNNDTARSYLRDVWVVLGRLPESDRAKIMHPTRAYNRQAQQDVIDARMAEWGR